MKILVTGAAGFVGQILAKGLLDAGHDVILVDIVKPKAPDAAALGSRRRSTCVQVDLDDNPSSVLSADLDAIYLLHGIMSAGSEEDIDLGYRANLYSMLGILEGIRKTCPGVRVIYTSSIGAYGPPLPDRTPSEATMCTPQTSYGTQKIMVEAILNDYNRRGLLTAFTLRLPGISVRSGPPTQAASSWMSSIIREPLQGRAVDIPCDDDFECWICSPRTLVKNMLHALTLRPDCMAPHIRQILLPGIAVSVREMLQALGKIGGPEAVRLVRKREPPPEVRAMLESWPKKFDDSKAVELGFTPDQPFLDTVRDFAEALKLD